MDEQAPIIGNLALKPDWDRLSESEPGCSFELESETAPSRLLHTRKTVFNSRKGGVLRLQSIAPSAIMGEHSSSETNPDLFEAAGVIVGDSFSREKRMTEISTSDDTTIIDEGTHYRIYSANLGGESRLISYVVVNQFVSSSWGDIFLTDEKSGASTPSLAGSFQLLIKDPTYKEEDALDILVRQIRKLHIEFAQWPGSYNQLLMAGSLDYCQSALTKAKRSYVVLDEKIVSSIRSYFADCLGILDQCSDAKTTLRRFNLQKIQDKFETLQETCSRHGIYPLLAELDISDIPRE